MMFGFAALLGLAAACKVANADMKKVEDLRHYYRDNGLDFFGDLIESGQDAANDGEFSAETGLVDERRHAKVELLADDARIRALTQLEGLLKSAQGPMRSELLLRKSTLLSDRARTAVYFQNNPVRTSKVGDAKAYLRQSIQTLQQIEREFPQHPKMDVVLFSIAYDFGDLRDSKSAYDYYGRLLSRFPASPLVGDAWLAQSEIDFDARRFGPAIDKLRKIVSAEHPRLKNFALYKLAWTLYNVKDLPGAITALERVIDGVNHASGAQRARLELRREALHDLVTFYADKPETDAPAEAADYFARVGRTPEAIAAEYAQTRAKRLATFAAKHASVPDEERAEMQLAEPEELLLRLAQLYRDQGKHLNAMVVAGALLDKLPKHPRSVALYRLRAESAEKLRRRDQVVTELERLAATVEHDLPSSADGSIASTAYQPIDEVLKTERSTMPALAAAAASGASGPLDANQPSNDSNDIYQRLLLKTGFDTLADFAAFLHGEWLKTHDEATARFALRAYDLGVRTSLQPWRGQPLDRAFELRRHRAQLSLALERWDDAAADFDWLALHAAAATSSEKVLTDDALGEIGALESWIKSPHAPAELAQATKGFKLHPLHRRLLDAYDRFLVMHLSATDDATRQQAAEVLVASARLDKEYRRNDESLTRLMIYAKRFSDQKDAVSATKDILALLNQGARWPELRDFATDLLKVGAYKNLPVEAEIKRSREFASLKLLETLEGEKDWDKAASKFAEFASENPDSAFASQALLKSANAALESAKLSKDPLGAIEKLQLATKAPDAGVRTQALLGLEPYYQRSFQWDKLKEVYQGLLARNAAAKSNLAAIEALGNEPFARSGGSLLTGDHELDRLLADIARYESELNEYRAVRFVKSNNNPARNFKKKTELEQQLAARADKLAAGAAQSLKGAADAWATLVKAELLNELAETIDSAALPAALNGAGASDADRKSYRETISAQSHELRDTAKTLAEDAARKLAAVDSPLDLTARVNAAADGADPAGARTHAHLVRRDLAKLWSTRPSTEGADLDNAPGSRAESAETAEIGRTARDLLRVQNPAEARAIELKLARAYAKSGKLGYAYAVASALTSGSDSKNDELAKQAAALRLSIDLARLPAKLTRSSQLSAQDRWALARWLAGRRSELAERERAWVDDALKTLLRAETEAPALQARAGD